MVDETQHQAVGPAEQHRAIITVFGRVQGVFFRAAARKEAQRLGLSGVAENLSDGSVRIIAEGPKEDIVALVQWCREGGPPLASVHNVTVQWQPPSGTFRDFSIR